MVRVVNALFSCDGHMVSPTTTDMQLYYTVNNNYVFDKVTVCQHIQQAERYFYGIDLLYVVGTPDPYVRQLKAGTVSSVASVCSLWLQALRLEYYPARKETE